MGRDWRPDFDAATVRREVEIIRPDLPCNAIRVQGADLARLETASRFALEQGLEVWFSPELWDPGPEETTEFLARGAEVAQRLREEWPERVVLSVGSELLRFSRGFIPGENVLERLAYPQLRELMVSGSTRGPLNQLLARLAATAHRAFRGKITYASIGLERVEWGPFDYIGVDPYRGDPMFDRYPELLQRYTSLGKPFVNTEFGCCTFQGADRRGGRGWEIVDWGQWPPKLRGNDAYDPAAQATELATLLRLNDEAGVYGAFAFTFVETGPVVSGGADRAMIDALDFDPDITHYALVKTNLDRRLGVTYPDVPWEPKQSFRAVADFYARA